MNLQKWENLIFKVEENFGIDRKYQEEFEVTETSDGQKIKGQREVIEFRGPLGKMKLEKVSQPKVVSKKVLSSRRVGGRVAVDYVYSDQDQILKFKIYQRRSAQDDWEEVLPETMGIK
ncbi:hypothetical protein K9K85_02140 [Patescibacteria group bacterium]|nr:hypothetical protein [Patescibacteria group bacterium]